MNRLQSLLATAAVLGASLLAPGAAHAAAPLRPTAVDPRPTIPAELTAADIKASNAKVQAAFGDLVTMWRAEFDSLGNRFTAPGLVRYRGATRSRCGVMGGNNAGYCWTDNTIYFDDVFVAGLAKRAGAALGTDGDMAAVGVIAHEMGHAVAMQLGHASELTYENEATADCLAGAFTRHAQAEGSIEAGDIDEAFWGMSTAGDPEPELTGNPRADRRIVREAALMGHGTREQRMQNFRTGLDGGAKACLADFRQLG